MPRDIISMLMNLPGQLSQGGHNIAPGGGRDYVNSVAPRAGQTRDIDPEDLITQITMGRAGPNVESIGADRVANQMNSELIRGDDFFGDAAEGGRKAPFQKPFFETEELKMVLDFMDQHQLPIGLNNKVYSKVLSEMDQDAIFDFGTTMGYSTNMPLDKMISMLARDLASAE